MDERGLSFPRGYWLEFDEESQTMSGTPQQDDVGTKMYWLAALDQGGKIGRTAFEIVVTE